MHLSQELIDKLSFSLLSDLDNINAYINNNYADYLLFLKEQYSDKELEKEKEFYEKYDENRKSKPRMEQ